MAQADKAQLEVLLSSVRTEDKAIPAMLERVAGESAWQVAGQREIVDPPAQIEKAVELQAKWGTAPGQAWQIGPHRLVCGDCRDEGSVGRLWADDGPTIRMMWTDPPYGVDYASKNAYLNRADRGNRIQVPIENDKLTAGEIGFLFGAAPGVAKNWGASGCVSIRILKAGILPLRANLYGMTGSITWTKSGRGNNDSDRLSRAARTESRSRTPPGRRT